MKTIMVYLLVRHAPSCSKISNIVRHCSASQSALGEDKDLQVLRLSAPATSSSPELLSPSSPSKSP